MLLIPPSLSRLAAQKLAAIGQKFRSDDDDDRNNGMMTMHVNRTHFLNETFHSPILFCLTNIQNKILENICSLFSMNDFRMKLNSKYISTFVRNCCSMGIFSMSNNFKIIWNFFSFITMTHPSSNRTSNIIKEF